MKNRAIWMIAICTGVCVSGFGNIITNLLIDGGFEAQTDLATNTSPWVTFGEDATASITVKTTVYHNGSKSASFNYYSDYCWMDQEITGATFDSSRTYELSFWMLSYDSRSPTYTNPSDLRAYMFVYANGQWNYVGKFLQANASDSGVWENFSGTIDGSAFSQYNGSPMKIRITTPSGLSGAEYKLAVDDVSFGVVPEPTSISLFVLSSLCVCGCRAVRCWR